VLGVPFDFIMEFQAIATISASFLELVDLRQILHEYRALHLEDLIHIYGGPIDQ